MFKYFQKLFNSHSAHFLPHDMTSDPKLNYTQVVALEFNVSYQEILNVLHGMNINKILYLDGFNSHFFISYWDTICELFLGSAHHLFKHQNLSNSIKHKLITLILKLKHYTNISHYRPIYLCNTFYKVIAKGAYKLDKEGDSLYY